MSFDSSTVTAGDDALASDYNNLRRDLVENAGDYASSTGSANAYVLAVDSQIVTAYSEKQVFKFKANFENTGAATLNVNSLGAKSVVKNGGDALVAGDIQSGQVVVVVYDGTNMQITSAVSSFSSPFFGDASDGNVTIASGTTTLTSDMYYDTLTLQTGAVLKPNGYKIFAHKIVREGTGKIVANGGNGGNGGAGVASSGGTASGGAAGSQANTAGTLPASRISGRGSDGGRNGGIATGASNGENADTNINGDFDAVDSGNGGDGQSAKEPKGTSGNNTTTLTNPLKTYNDVYSLIDPIDTFSRLDLPCSTGGAGGGGAGGSAIYHTGGAGGGGGAPGGIVWVAAYEFELANTNLFIDVSGGVGGDGGDAPGPSGYGGGQSAAGGGGGGAGGDGGIAIVIYKITDQTIQTSDTIDISFGVGGALGTGQVDTTIGNNGDDGGAGGGGNIGQLVKVETSI